MTVKEVWKSRMQSFWQEAISYLRIIVVGYAYLPILMIIGIAWFYHLFLEWLPADFPAGLLAAFLISLPLTYSPVRTFLHPADLVFLLPRETKMGGYFLLSLGYSFVIQAVNIIVAMILLQPLYNQRISSSLKDWMLDVLLLTVLKGWNLFGSWREQHLRDETIRKWQVMLRFSINVLLASLFLYQFSILVILAAFFIVVLVSIYYYRISPKSSYHWMFLISVEQSQKQAFYSFVQWFVDVPQIPAKIKDRRLFTALLHWLPFQQRWAYVHLFLRTFLRFKDLSGRYTRLVLIGMAGIYYLDGGYAPYVFMAMILIMNSLQLFSMWGRVRHMFWGSIHPVPEVWKVRGFVKVVWVLLIIQVLLMAVARLAGHGWGTLIPFLLYGFMVSILLIVGIHNKITRMSS